MIEKTPPSKPSRPYHLDRLNPFGLRLSFPEPNPLSILDPKFLDQMLRGEKLLLIRGCLPPQPEELADFCKSFPNAELLEWEFGAVMEMRAESEAKNYLFSQEKVPFHWDGAFHKVPRYLVFQCLQAPPIKTGGQTLFTNTENIVKRAKREDLAQWQKVHLKYRTKKVAHYGGEIRVKLMQQHPTHKSSILRFAEPVETALNPVSLEVEGLSPTESKDFLKSMTSTIYDDSYCYQHSWRIGDILIADNHSLIHGRRAFSNPATRHLRRIQIM